jgi:hypothetical protein
MSKPRRHGRGRFCRRDHGNDFELSHVAPVRHPLIEQARVLTLHYLKAPAQVFGDPTVSVRHPFRHEATAFSEAPVHGNRIAVPKCFDDHVQHTNVLLKQQVMADSMFVTDKKETASLG